MVFAAVFFASIGMLLDPQFLLDNLGSVAILVAFIVVVKVVTTGIAARLFGLPWPVVGASALLLAQLGEFAFVLERSGREAGLTPFGEGETGSQTFIAASVALFAVTPAFYALGQRLLRRSAQAGAEAEAEGGELVVVVGAPARAARIEQIVKSVDATASATVLAADVSALTARREGSSGQSPAAMMLIVDASAGDAVAPLVRDALRAVPPVPIVVRTSTRLDVDDVAGADDLIVIVDDEEGDRALAAAIERAAHRDAG